MSDAFTVCPAFALGLTVTLSSSPAVIVYSRMSGSHPWMGWPLTSSPSSAASGASTVLDGCSNGCRIVNSRVTMVPSVLVALIVPVNTRIPLSPSPVGFNVTVASSPLVTAGVYWSPAAAWGSVGRVTSNGVSAAVASSRSMPLMAVVFPSAVRCSTPMLSFAFQARLAVRFTVSVCPLSSVRVAFPLMVHTGPAAPDGSSVALPQATGIVDPSDSSTLSVTGMLSLSSRWPVSVTVHSEPFSEPVKRVPSFNVISVPWTTRTGMRNDSPPWDAVRTRVVSVTPASVFLMSGAAAVVDTSIRLDVLPPVIFSSVPGAWSNGAAGVHVLDATS